MRKSAVRNLHKTCRSLIVVEQPEPVLKTQQSFTVAVRLLLGDKLGIQNQLNNGYIKLRLCREQHVSQLCDQQMQPDDKSYEFFLN
jgi:hypothetical protein